MMTQTNLGGSFTFANTNMTVNRMAMARCNSRVHKYGDLRAILKKPSRSCAARLRLG